MVKKYDVRLPYFSGFFDQFNYDRFSHVTLFLNVNRLMNHTSYLCYCDLMDIQKLMKRCVAHAQHRTLLSRHKLKADLINSKYTHIN